MSVNKAILVGNLGKDPESRHTPQGTPVCQFPLATTKTYFKDSEKVEKTEWHRVVVWGKTAENCVKYLRKGRAVFIEGEIQTREWEDKKHGIKRYTTEVVAQNVQFLNQGNKHDQTQKIEQHEERRSAPEDVSQGAPHNSEIPW